MKLLKLMASIAAGVCVFAACSARAQYVTNTVTFSAVTFNQGPTNINAGNTVTNYGPTHTVSYKTSSLLQEIGHAVNANGTGKFSSAAKLVLISGNNGAYFAVIDGANLFDLSSSGYNIMNFTFPIPAQIMSGSQSTPPEQKLTQSAPIGVAYDDTAYGSGNQLVFTLIGLMTYTETKTAPVNNMYTDTVKGKISGMTGGGTSQGNPFTATASFSFGGSAKLPSS